MPPARRSSFRPTPQRPRSTASPATAPACARGGEAYADALAASRVRQTEAAALEVHAYVQTDAGRPGHCWARVPNGRTGANPRPRRHWRRWIDRWHCRLVRGLRPNPLRRARAMSDTGHCPAIWASDRLPRLRLGRRLAWCAQGWFIDVSDRSGVRDRGRSGDRRPDRRRATVAVGAVAADRRTRWRYGAGRADLGPVRAAGQRQGRRGHQRREYRSRNDRRAVNLDVVLLDIDERRVATATLNQPEVGNAYP